VAVAPSDGSVFTARQTVGLNPGFIAKWTAAGAAGTPASFGSDFFHSAAVNPVNGNVYAFGQTGGIYTFQPDGTPVGSPFVVDTSSGARIGTDAAGNIYFPNLTDKTVEKFSSAGALLQTFGPTAGGPSMNGPLDAAVDAAGNVYVADQDVAVNEVQSVLRGVTGNVATGGTYVLTFNGQSTSATGTGNITTASGTGDVNRATGTGDRTSVATGTGNRTSGSNVITNLVTTTGTYAVGEAISGTGIPVGTTIATVEADSLTLSAPATSTGTAGALFSGSKTLSNVATTTGTFAVGMTITGTGLATGTTITAVGANTITLSIGVTSAGTAGALTAGNVTNANASAGTFTVGMHIAGTGIPANATITAINGGTLTLSAVPTAAGTGVALAAGSRTISGVTTDTGAFTVGKTITGAGIPAAATITAADANSITLSATPTASGTAVPLTADIGFNASATVVDTALEALPAIGAGNVSVSGTVAAARDVTFGGTLAGTDVSELVCDGTNLTYAAAPPTPRCTVTTTTPGSYSPGRVIKFESDGDFASNFLAPPGKFTALAVDVDRTANEVFVAGGISNQVADVEITKHNLAGTELDSFGAGVTTVGNNQVGLAVNPATGNVYASRSNGDVRIWSEVQPPTVVTGSATSIGQTTATLNGTVNPNAQAVTACEFEYGTTTSYGQTAPCVPDAATIGSGSSPVSVSANVTGLNPDTEYHFRLTATNAAAGETNGNDGTFETDAIPAPTATTGAASSIAQTTATLNASVNPNGSNVTSCQLQYGTTTSYGQTAACTPSPGSGSSAVSVSANITGLTAGTEYHFRVVATNGGGTTNGSDATFSTTVDPPPTVVTGSASSIAQTTATLSGSVNPNGTNVTSCQIQYGTTTSYGQTAACSPSPGSGSSAVSVSANVTGLTVNTTYHFRVVATNAGGPTNGNDATFNTLPQAPTAVTGAASAITQTGATLNGSVNPNSGNVTSCQLQYGTTTSYGQTAACSPSPGSGSSAVSVSAAVTGLTAGTTYHFRVVATNAGGTTNGSDATFAAIADTCETNPALCPPPPSCANTPALCPPPPQTCQTNPALCPAPPANGDAAKLASCKQTATKAFKKASKKAAKVIKNAKGKSQKAKKAAKKKAKSIRKKATAKRKKQFASCQTQFGG
jgi:phosphodiesterase/alkaline phosphatase D-like protein